jgi:CHAT domain
VAGAHPFAGVATALIKKRVPAVVAMQFPISDQAAILFARTFYECILLGHTVDAAVVEGRKELHSNKVTASEWATPVLYLRSKDGVLFEWEKNDAAAASAAPVSLAPGTGAATATAPATATAAEDPWGSERR